MQKYLSISFLALIILSITSAAEPLPITPSIPTPAVAISALAPAPGTSEPQMTAAKAAVILPGKPSTEKHLWNLQDVDILKVIAEVSRQTGKNFIVDPQVTGKITIISSNPLNGTEIYPVFLAALQVLGYAAVPQQNLVKITPIRDANQNASRVVGKDGPASGDELIVRVLSLQHVAAIQLTPSLSPLVPSWANVSAYAPSNSIIVTGTANVVNRIAGIVERVDTPAANGIDLVRLQYADAAEVVKSLDKLQQAGRNSSGDFGSAISADTRSNSILLSGTEATRLHYKVLISQLDVSTQNSITDTQVIRLKYASVKSILPLLRAMVRQSVDSGAAQSTANTAANTNMSAGGANTAPQAYKLPELSNAILNAGSASANDQSGVTIVGDVPNNALVVTAPPNVMRTLRTIIKQLDLRPKQILVQGIIAQIDAQKLSELGIQWGASTPANAAAGAPYAYQGAGVGVGFITRGSMSALITAIASDTNNNILSTPSIMVMNNGNAEIQVGGTVPVITGSVNPLNGQTIGSVNTYGDRSFGLVLNVAPQITDDNSISMLISQSNSAITKEGTATQNPTTSNQLLKTSVLVKNSEILVLGGLLDAKEQIVVDKVPLLGDIPLLGLAFQHKKKIIVKKDLVIFLRPIIVDSPESEKRISSNKYDYMRDNQQNAVRNRNALPNSSVLPDRNHPELPAPFSKPDR